VRQAIYRGVTRIAAARRIPLIDVAAAFARDAAPETLYAYPGSHYNAKGYRVVAETVIDALDHRPR